MIFLAHIRRALSEAEASRLARMAMCDVVGNLEMLQYETNAALVSGDLESAEAYLIEQAPFLTEMLRRDSSITRH